MKAWSIAVKDTLVRFRDRNAIILMVAAPLLIAFVMGLAFGGQGAAASPIFEIPLIVVNADQGEWGQEFAAIITEIEVETREGIRPLFTVTEMADRDVAVEQVELGEVRGVVYIPPIFSTELTDSFEDGEVSENRTATLVEVFTDPTANVSPGIIRGVVQRIASGFSTVVLGNVVAVEQLLDKTTDIPVLFVNEDRGPVSAAVAAAFDPQNFEGLFALESAPDMDAAQEKLATGDAEAIIQVQDGFSQAVMEGGTGEAVAGLVAVVPAPGSLSAPIVEAIALGIASGFGSDAQAGAQPVTHPVLANLEDLESILLAENDRLGRNEAARDWITVSTSLVGESQEFNLLNYFVPSMAIFFLMFTVFDGTRSILQEERDGTLHRLMTTPTSRTEILLGKIGGVFMTGILQFAVLVAISGLVFDVDWGTEPLGILLMVVATVAASTSLGALVAAFARNNNQAGVVGTAVTLIFAILGGNFIDFRAIPAWLNPVSRLTINRWAMEGFTNLTLFGQSLLDVMPNIVVLFGLGALFFVLALLLFNRRFVR